MGATLIPAIPPRPFRTLGFALLLAACAPGATYRDATAGLPDRYGRLVPVPVVTGDAAQWWHGFHDPVLDALVAQGLSGSVTVAVAEARLAEAAALARRAGDPVSGSLSQAKENGNAIGASSQTTSLSASVGLFGGQRRAAEAALARLQAAQYGVQDARLTLLSTLAQAYVDLRFYQESVVEQQADLVSRRRTRDDIATLLGSGAATQLDRLRAEALVSETEARIPALNAAIARQQNRIATLLGVPAGALGIDLGYPGRQPLPATTKAIGVPADLVRRRPDIGQAERLYAAAVSDIGVAEAARYPSLSLSGQIVAPTDAALASSRALTMGLVLPLFDQPGLAAQADAARARADQAYLQWRGAVLSAVEGVETALVGVSASRLTVVAAQRGVALNTEALDLSRRMLAPSGEITVLDLLDRERAVSDARSALSQARRDYATNVIALYVALGLGAGG